MHFLAEKRRLGSWDGGCLLVQEFGEESRIIVVILGMDSFSVGTKSTISFLQTAGDVNSLGRRFEFRAPDPCFLQRSVIMSRRWFSGVWFSCCDLVVL